MKISKMNKTKRQGVSVVNILAGLALLAITAAVVGPRFSAAKLPGYTSNLTAEVTKIEGLIENYTSSNEGKSTGLTDFNTLVDKGIITGSMLNLIGDGTTGDVDDDIDGGTTVAGNAGKYFPRWAKGDISIEITSSGSGNLTNIFIDVSNSTNVLKSEWLQEFEDKVVTFVSSKWGKDVINSSATAITATATAINSTYVAPTGGAEKDGTIEFTVE